MITKLSIASNCLNLSNVVLWFSVHCLMLSIFIKYGKPLEDNETTLIRNKLIEVFQEQACVKN